MLKKQKLGEPRIASVSSFAAPDAPEAQEIVRAIRSGEVDAFVVQDRVQTLRTDEPPYQQMIEDMRDGALVLALDGTIFYSNRGFARMVGATTDALYGTSALRFVLPASVERFKSLLTSEGGRSDVLIAGADSTPIPASLIVSPMRFESSPACSVLVSDLRESRRLRELSDLKDELVGENEQLTVSRDAAERERDRYEELFQFAPDAYLVTDLQGVIIEANQAAIQLLTSNPDALMRSNLTLLAQTEDRPAFVSRFGKQVIAQKTGPWRVGFAPPGRSEFIAELTLAPARDETGVVVGYRWLIRDVTELIRAQEALERQRQQLELLSSVTAELLHSDEPGAIIEHLCRRVSEFLDCDCFFNYLIDEKLGCLHLNARWGITDELVSQFASNTAICGCVARDRQRIIAEDVQNSRDPRTDVVRAIGIRAFACYPLHVGDKTLGTLSFGSRRRDRFSSDDLSLMSAVANHISIAIQRVMGQRALAESEARFRVMGETVPFGVWLANADGGVEYLSPSFLEIAGMSAEESRGFGWAKRLPVEDVEAIKAAWLRCVETGSDWECEHRMLDRSNRMRTILSCGRPVRDADGRITGWAGLNLDITDRKTIEEELASKAAELQRKSEELARSNSELEGFAHAASHDLRSPLLSIAGCVELLEEEMGEKLDQENRELLTHIRSAVTHMSALLKKLLDYSRIGAAALSVSDVPLGDVLAQAVVNLGSGIAATGAKLTHDELPIVSGDAQLMTQLFQNLIENAIKYRSIAPPQIHVSAEECDGACVVSVRDNGVGIESRYFDVIFKMFQRVNGGAAGKSGAGIGLATCKRIVERHHGRIWVESEPGRGSTFFFTIARQSTPPARTE